MQPLHHTLLSGMDIRFHSAGEIMIVPTPASKINIHQGNEHQPDLMLACKTQKQLYQRN